jgi:hypothetical protein
LSTCCAFIAAHDHLSFGEPGLRLHGEVNNLQLIQLRFGTFTVDLNRSPAWFARCGADSGINGVSSDWLDE